MQQQNDGKGALFFSYFQLRADADPCSFILTTWQQNSPNLNEDVIWSQTMVNFLCCRVLSFCHFKGEKQAAIRGQSDTFLAFLECSGAFYIVF